jgi:hypothetical protein
VNDPALIAALVGQALLLIAGYARLMARLAAIETELRVLAKDHDQRLARLERVHDGS